MLLIRDSAAGPAPLDLAALPRALMEAAPGVGESVRIHRPAVRAVAFSKQDRASDDYRAAVGSVSEVGYEAFERLPGGRAAVFHPGTLSLAVQEADPEARTRIHERFERLAGAVERALRNVGVDARVGELPGEYCPGRWSIHHAGRVKLCGIGQRVVRGAVHTGAVIVLEDSEAVNEPLIGAYRALGLDLDPDRTGSVAEVAGADAARAVTNALVEELGRIWSLEESGIPEHIMSRARDLAPDHVPAPEPGRPDVP